MRKLGIAVLVIIALIIIVALVAPAFINVDKYHDRIQAELSSKLGRPVTLGKMHLRLLPPRFRVENVTIAEDPRFLTGRPFAQANELTVSPEILPLIRGEVALKEVNLEKPTVELVRNPAGTWNFSTLGQPAPAAQPQAKPAQPQPKLAPQQPAQQQQPQQKSQQQLVLNSFNINDGQIGFTDLQKRQPRAVYDHIDLSLSNFAPDRQFGIALTAHLPGGGNQVLKLDANVGPMQQADMMRTPVDGTIKLDQVSLAGLKKFVNSQQLAGTDATLTGEMKLKNDNGVIASSGNLKADQVALHGAQVGYPISANFKLSDDLNNSLIKIDNAALKLGATPVNISGTLNAKPTPAEMDLHVKTTDASLTEAARLAAAAGVAFSPGMNVQGRVSGDITARGKANQPELNGQLSARDLVVSGKDLPQAVSIKEIALKMTPQAIQSNDFNVSTGGTNLKARFGLTQYTSPAAMVDATLQTANANLGEILSMAKAYGVKATEGMTGSGMLDLNVHVTGPMKNPNALNFAGNGKLANAQVKTATMTKPLVIRNAGLQFTQNSMSVQNLAASLGSTNASGQATVRNFAAPNVQFTLNADKVNVAELESIMGTSETQKTAALGGFSWQLVPTAEAAAPPQPSPLANVTGGGNVSIGNVIYDQLQLEQVKSPIALDHGVIRMQPLTAQVYGGTENGSIVIDTRPTPSLITVSSSLQKVDANKLISSVSSVKQVLYGLLSSNANTRFAIPANGGADAIARSLNGTLAIDLANGKIANMDMLYQVANIGKFLSGQSQPKQFTDLLKLTGNFNVVNGVATTNNLKALLAEGASLAAAGTVNLVNQGLDMHVTAVLPKSLTQKIGGQNIGGLMQTALANKNGELVVPILLTGSFTSPRFAPDVETMAKMKLNNLLPTSQNPGQLTSGILGGLLGGKNQAGQQQGQQGQQGLGGILGALTGKQQQQPNAQQPQGQQPQQGQQTLPNGEQPQQSQQQQAQPQQQQQQQQNQVGDLLNSILNKKKKQQQQQQPPKPQPPQ